MIPKGSTSLPHPVLGIEDDMTGKFSVLCVPKISRERREVILDGTLFEIENEFINQLVTNNHACVKMNIRCSSTMRSWSCSCTSPIRIPEHEICDYIDVEVLIVATNSIPNYCDSSFNPIFDGVVFQVEAGDIIGMAGKKRIELPRKDEKLGMMTMFEFKAIPHGSVISVDASNDQIKIRYPKEADGTSQLKNMFARAPWNAFHVFILPAIEAALTLVRDEPEEAQNFAWYGVLANLLGDQILEIDDDHIHAHAQRIAMSLLNGMNPMHEAAKELNILYD
jgi:hypothetical protein